MSAHSGFDVVGSAGEGRFHFFMEEAEIGGELRQRVAGKLQLQAEAVLVLPLHNTLDEA
ncbi:hypothetical protein SAMN05428983_1495 [Agrobacterium fabrum]|uniref:Uncharacterized protein n=1 Tax=Agrobacterium fabrum TaxID=1176649 RepID=A0A7Z7BJL1_9HYPH|nr:hypothetical protein SAMN05428983_1495 [Agrobacterium fabrum]